MSEAEPKTPAQSATDANLGAVVPIRAKPAQDERPSRKIIAFAKEHPVLVVAGGLAAGALVSALLPKRLTRGVAGKALNRSIALAEAAGGAAALFGRNASDKAHDLGIGAKREAGHLADRAEKVGGAAAERLRHLGLAALAAAGALGKATAEKAGTTAEKASKFGHEAAEFASETSHRFARRIQDFAQRISH
ncbi:MAG: hypothetical protein QM808_06150 [Steroidobacteraceae bacterium]